MTKIVTPCNAIPSWEGYEYQGHIALNIALEKLYKMISNSIDFTNLNLEIEGVEDFSILENDTYKTLHQVKLGSVSLTISDKFAFIINILQNSAEHGYFHINKSHSIAKNFLSETLQHIETLRGELSKPLKHKKDLLPSDPEDDYIIIEDIKVQTPKASIYQILYYICDGAIDDKTVKKAIINAEKTLKDCNSAITKYQLNDKCILSEWSDKFDNSKEVKMHNITKVQQIINMQHPDWGFVDLEYCEFVYQQLISSFKDIITDFFISKIKNGRCVISFSKIHNELIKNYTEDMESVKYKYYLIRRAIKKLYCQFPTNNCKVSSCAHCTIEANCNLKNQMELFENKDNDEKQNILFNLLLENPKEICNLPSEDLIKFQLLKALMEINKLSITEKNTICAKSEKHEFYRLSLDDSREQERLRLRLQNGIKESIDKSILYECDVLITDRLSEKYFKLDGSSVNVLENQQLNELQSITGVDINDEIANCNKPKIIRLIDINGAQGELLR